jgi:hypothetical protein
MRTVFFTVLLATLAAASAADSRGVQIGESCRHAAEVEVSLGTQPQQEIESMLSQGIVAFVDRSVAGQYTRFMYSCTETPGTISRYSIIVNTRSESRAWDIYAAAKAEAVARLGIPTSDTNTPQATERLKELRRQGLTSMRQVATWTSAEHQNVTLDIEFDDDEWSIATIVVSKGHQESPNTSLERTRER